MGDMDFVDVSDSSIDNNKKRDKFMIYIYISILVLIILGLVTYFFGYEVLKPIIKV